MKPSSWSPSRGNANCLDRLVGAGQAQRPHAVGHRLAAQRRVACGGILQLGLAWPLASPDLVVTAKKPSPFNAMFVPMSVAFRLPCTVVVCREFAATVPATCRLGVCCSATRSSTADTPPEATIGAEVAAGQVPVSAPLLFTANDCLDIGTCLGSPVSMDYRERAPFPFEGHIHKVHVAYT